MDFSAFITELGNRITTTSPPGDGTAIYAVTLADGLSITLEGIDNGQRCAISGLICRYPPDAERHPLFDRLMEAHAYGVVTDGAYFAANRRAGKVVMTKVLELRNSVFEELVAEIDHFIKHYQVWRAEYDAGRLTTAPDAAVAAPTPNANFA